MKIDVDIQGMADIPDPLPEIAELPIPPRPDARRAPPPIRARVATLRAWALGAAVAYECLWLAIFNKRGDLSAVRRWTLFAEFTIPLAATALALLAGTSGGERGMGQTKGRLAALALASPTLFVVATVLVGPADVDVESFGWHALRCFLVTGLLGLGPFVLAVWTFRRAFVSMPAWRTAALGLASACAAVTTMSVLCSVGSPAHVLVGHGGVMVVATVTGALLGRRLCEA